MVRTIAWKVYALTNGKSFKRMNFDLQCSFVTDCEMAAVVPQRTQTKLPCAMVASNSFAHSWKSAMSRAGSLGPLEPIVLLVSRMYFAI